jgi:hypothetical protein
MSENFDVLLFSGAAVQYCYTRVEEAILNGLGKFHKVLYYLAQVKSFS